MKDRKKIREEKEGKKMVWSWSAKSSNQVEEVIWKES